MPVAELERPKEYIAYGCKVSHNLPPVLRELAFFRRSKSLIAENHLSYTGEGRLFHLQQFCHLQFGKNFEMHEWAEDCLELFCNYREASVTGPKSASKTTSAAIYALAFWLANPTETAVIVCSTTVQGLRKRIWKEIKRYFRYCVPIAPEANLVESKMSIQAVKNDDGNGIFGFAVAGGQTQKALGRIIGFHPKNLLIIIDEATDTPEAIDEACANLDKVEGEFQVIRLGNAKSRFDPHGKSCEPKAGWKSITRDDEFWETVHGGCAHLDGSKSPNIKLGKRRYPYLIDEKDMAALAKRYGENSPQMWRFGYGFWAPDGAENTVLTETMAVMFDVRARCSDNAKTEWLGIPTLYAALDPAFGGDRCILKIAKFGTCRDGKKRVEFTESIAIKLEADATVPIDYQIATQTREICKGKGISPNHFGTDSTGTGRGVAAILQREWSRRIVVVSFNGAASQRPVSNDNPKSCREEYCNFVTELWFSVRKLVECDQVRGLTDDDVKEFCLREWKEMARGYQLEDKPEMKKRTGGVSPDLADAAAVLTEVCRQNGLIADELGISEENPDTAVEYREQREQAARLDFDAYPDCYTDGSL